MGRIKTAREWLFLKLFSNPERLLFALVLIGTSLIHADITLPSILSNNMVLQQKTSVKFWGWADAGENIEVIPSWNNIGVRTQADRNGKFFVNLQTPKAGNNYEITCIGKNILHITNILIGEVWLCSGQSNMEFPIVKTATSWQTGINDYEKEISQANYNEIRLFYVEKKNSSIPLNNCVGEWRICTPENTGTFSAVAYFFGRYLFNKLKVPIGLIESAFGGTPAELWTNRKLLSDSTYISYWNEYNSSLTKYNKYLERKDSTARIVHRPAEPSSLWNGMISPIIPFTLKGVIWYQGESNDDRSDKYNQVMTNLITSWRKEWMQGDFPFYFVQIAPHKDKTPELREAQLRTWQSVQNTGMAVITDAGDSVDIHPKNKQVVGERLAFWALAKDYGFSEIQYSGPIYKNMQVDGGNILLKFDYVGKGLISKDGPLQEFTIAGADKIFYPAEATISGENVLVHSDVVRKPVAVRFAWKNFMRPNLYNIDGLPASPFRTDNWKKSL